jgi:hypothetical protein
VKHAASKEREKRPPDTVPWRLPEACPVCGTRAVRAEGEVALRCPNLECPVQVREVLRHFASRNALDVDGLGEQRIEQLIAARRVRRPSDLFTLTAEELAGYDRMGEKSAQNLVAALERAKDVSLARFLNALGIRHVGERGAAILARAFPDLDRLLAAPVEQIEAVDEIGPTIARAVREWLDDPVNRAEVDLLRQRLRIETGAAVEHARSDTLAGKTFVITGTLAEPRATWQARLEAAGAKVTARCRRRRATCSPARTRAQSSRRRASSRCGDRRREEARRGSSRGDTLSRLIPRGTGCGRGEPSRMRHCLAAWDGETFGKFARGVARRMTVGEAADALRRRGRAAPRLRPPTRGPVPRRRS